MPDRFVADTTFGVAITLPTKSVTVGAYDVTVKLFAFVKPVTVSEEEVATLQAKRAAESAEPEPLIEAVPALVQPEGFTPLSKRRRDKSDPPSLLIALPRREGRSP